MPKPLEAAVNVAVAPVPNAETATTITTAISAAIKAYSIAVTALVCAANLLIMRCKNEENMMASQKIPKNQRNFSINSNLENVNIFERFLKKPRGTGWQAYWQSMPYLLV
ncbi:MAG TPA: hypothetical protein PLO16_12415 [Acidocella sp.]|nr:hypothetical protein [Acidocella sp.]